MGSSRRAEFGNVVFHNAVQIVEMMHDKAKVESASLLKEYGYPAQPGETVRVYRGYSTKDSQSLGLLRSSASHAMRLLIAMRCLTLLATGTKSSYSVYLVNYIPTLEQFNEFKGRSQMLERKITPTNYDSLINDMEDLRERVQDLTRRVAYLEEYISAGHNV